MDKRQALLPLAIELTKPVKVLDSTSPARDEIEILRRYYDPRTQVSELPESETIHFGGGGATLTGQDKWFISGTPAYDRTMDYQYDVNTDD